jgi:hypothetical protein
MENEKAPVHQCKRNRENTKVRRRSVWKGDEQIASLSSQGIRTQQYASLAMTFLFFSAMKGGQM